MQKKIEHPPLRFTKSSLNRCGGKGGKGKTMADDFLAARRFKALVGEWTPEELGRFFWLTSDDTQQVKTCRGAANRLGFATQPAAAASAALSFSRQQSGAFSHCAVCGDAN